MKGIPIYSDEDFDKKFFPEVKLFDKPENNKTKWVHRVTKATLQHNNGTVSEMKFINPIYTTCGEPQELLYRYMSDYIQHLTKCFLQITRFQIHIGSIDRNGNEYYSIHYPAFEIPLNKVYHDRKWQDPQKVKESEWKKRGKAPNRKPRFVLEF